MDDLVLAEMQGDHSIVAEIDNERCIREGYRTQIHSSCNECYLRVLGKKGRDRYLQLGSVFRTSDNGRILKRKRYDAYYYFHKARAIPFMDSLLYPDDLLIFTIDFISADGIYHMGRELRAKLTETIVHLSKDVGSIRLMKDPVKAALDPNPYKPLVLSFDPEIRFRVLCTILPIVLDRSLWQVDQDVIHHMSTVEDGYKVLGIDDKRFEW